MKFDTPAGSNPIDRLNVVGQPLTRIDRPLKTTGTATYAYEQHAVAANQAYGYIVGAPIAKGRIVSYDLAAARAAPGVLGIVTAMDAGRLGVGEFYVAPALAGPDIVHYHQAVAIVVADTLEQARAAASLVKVHCVATAGAFDLAAARDRGVMTKSACTAQHNDINYIYFFGGAAVRRAGSLEDLGVLDGGAGNRVDIGKTVLARVGNRILGHPAAVDQHQSKYLAQVAHTHRRSPGGKCAGTGGDRIGPGADGGGRVQDAERRGLARALDVVANKRVQCLPKTRSTAAVGSHRLSMLMDIDSTIG